MSGISSFFSTLQSCSLGTLAFWDWVIVAAVVLLGIWLTWFSTRYCKGVSGFLAASRLAGPYMLAIAPGVASVIGIVALFEQNYNNGVSSGWWQQLVMPVSMMLTLFGFVRYRLRQTRALTLSQFLEQRYSRSFRVFAGILCWISGVLNYGIFPMICVRFLVVFFGFPDYFQIQGHTFETYPVMLAIYLLISCYMACAGGQVSILITGFFQNLISFVAVTVFLYFMMNLFGFDWHFIKMGWAAAPDQATNSLFNPFKVANADGFNIWYIFITLLFNCYTRCCWQGGSGFAAAPKTPHAGMMSDVIARWRSYAFYLLVMTMGMGCYAFFHLDCFHEQAAPILDKLAAMDPKLISQARLPLFLSTVLPVGLLGLFAVMALAGSFCGDASSMHSWGTIFIQDIVMPLRKKPFGEKWHLLLLKLSIVAVALFAGLFSYYFPLRDFVQMYFMITGAVYMGGAGAVLIGGLYWKRGSTPAAWTAMILGTIICLGGVIMQSFWPQIAPHMQQLFPGCEFFKAAKFPISAPMMTLATMVVAIGSYVLVSLLGPRHEEDMDKLLYRGKYRVEGEEIRHEKFSMVKLVGVTKEHTRIERVLMWATFGFMLTEFTIFAVITILQLTTDLMTSDVWMWVQYLKVVPIYLFFGTVATVWITIGSLCDAVQLVKDLKNFKADNKDDGYVQK
ncbi:MAG: hypothetical protein MJ025_00400 [Victivallaceae bacterium]|nr:hypothetical protein [Victivallaceae bacterium]